MILHKKRFKLRQDWPTTPTWPPFNCFVAPTGSYDPAAPWLRKRRLMSEVTLFQSYRDYSYPFTLSKVGDPPLNFSDP